MRTVTIDVLDESKTQLLLDVLHEFRFIRVASFPSTFSARKMTTSLPMNDGNPEQELDALSWDMGVRSYTSREQLYERNSVMGMRIGIA